MFTTHLLLADAHGDIKVNAWEAPTQISQWKEEHVRPRTCLRVTDQSLQYCLGCLCFVCGWHAWCT